MPKNLFKYPCYNGGEESGERTKVVKDFAFPNGVFAQKLNFNPLSNKQDEEVEDII